MPYKECNKTGGDCHVCKCIEYLQHLIAITTKGEGAKVRTNISARAVCSKYVQPPSPPASQIRVTMGNIGVHGAAINASFIKAHIVLYKPIYKLH